MKNRMIKIALVVGLTAATLAAQAKVLPEFMNTQQLTTWRAQHAPAVALSQAPGESVQFFTGKLYDAASGNYLFKYRAYSPNLARWTSTDPSGFPDGANNYEYSCNRSSWAFDPTGLDTQHINMPVYFLTETGSWQGDFVWTFAHGQESAGTKIIEKPGFAGWTHIGASWKITSNDISIGADSGYAADVVDRSSFEAKTDSHGNQWKRWVVDQTVTLSKKLILGVELVKTVLDTLTNKKVGDWYE